MYQEPIFSLLESLSVIKLNLSYNSKICLSELIGNLFIRYITLTFAMYFTREPFNRLFKIIKKIFSNFLFLGFKGLIGLYFLLGFENL